jgi:hypothetical protein
MMEVLTGGPDEGYGPLCSGFAPPAGLLLLVIVASSLMERRHRPHDELASRHRTGGER